MSSLTPIPVDYLPVDHLPVGRLLSANTLVISFNNFGCFAIMLFCALNRKFYFLLVHSLSAIEQAVVLLDASIVNEDIVLRFGRFIILDFRVDSC